jgi:hypothetical protein
LQQTTGPWNIIHVKVLAVVSDPLLGPKLLHHHHNLTKPGQSLLFGHAEGVELEVPPTQCRGQNEFAAAYHVQRGNLLGGLNRMV